jgi:epoxyqueuosine reductase
VRGAAVWALAQLLPRAEFAVLAQSAASAESDASVVEEWQAA